MKYSCLKEEVFKDKQGYQIVAIRQEDIESIRLWRNAQLDILRQKKPFNIRDAAILFSKKYSSKFSTRKAFPNFV